MRYAREVGFKPARGWSLEGSGKGEAMYEVLASVLEGRGEVVNSSSSGSEGEFEGEELEGAEEVWRPVRVVQIDILVWRC